MMKCLITWIGSFRKRVMKGMSSGETFDFVVWLLESVSEEWLEFQRQCLEETIKPFGEFYRSPLRSKVIEFETWGIADTIPPGTRERECYKKIFNKLFRVITEIRSLHPKAEFTIDFSGTPRAVSLILAFIAMSMSTKESRIRLQMTPKGFEVSPKYYAPKDSRYFNEFIKDKDAVEQMTLNEFRKIEAEDEGGYTMKVELPIIKFDLFDFDSPKTPCLITLFSKIPASDRPPKSTNNILKEMDEWDLEMISRVLPSKRRRREKWTLRGRQDEIKQVREISPKLAELLEKTLRSKEKRSEIRPLKIWITRNLQSFEDLGIVELEKRGKSYLAKRTWAGDLIADIISEQYKNLRQSTKKVIAEVR